MQEFGHDIGADYQLVNYTQETEYLKKLAKESDRMKLVDIGPTAEGRRQYMSIISSPENMAKLDHYREISEKLARAKDLTDDQAHALAQEGKSVVWIDGGLHASETVGAQQLIETIYELNSRTDPETMRFLHDDIVLLTFANPDGMELVSNWYMRNPDPTKRSLEGIPRLWQKYIGHDDNRDFFASNMPETTNVNRILSRVWYPQIVYNHHQAGPAGTVVFMPPFRDPNSYHFDPLLVLGIEAVGTAMHERLVEEGKPGSIAKSGTSYSTWYNGGLRTISYFHNQIGLLTEIIGNPTPEPLPLVPAQQLARNDLVDPIAPQMWHFAQSIAYEQTNNRAVMDYASRERTHLLYNIYLMGKDSIDAGNKDSWTITPNRVDALEAAAAKATGASLATIHSEGRSVLSPDAGFGGGGRGAGVPASLYDTVLHDPAYRDPRGYIVSADQPDFPTATKFINTLMKTGIEVQQATAAFDVAGKHYPAGSYIVMCNQAFRPEILDQFEPQDYPNDFAYPGGPPNRPYDLAGWTLAFQMGVKFDRELEPFTGPFATITTDLAKPMPGTIAGVTGTPAGYLVSHEYNDAYTLTNRLLKAGQPVYWMKEGADAGGKKMLPGALWLPYSADTAKILETATKTLGIDAVAVAQAPVGTAIQLHPLRIGLADVYGGSMPSGWIRWLFEQYEFPFKVVYPQELDGGNLHASYDVLVFPDGVIRAMRGERGGGFRFRQPEPDEIPAEFRPWLGSITPAKTLPQLEAFVNDGGALLAIGSSTSIASYLKLPLEEAPTEILKGARVPVPPDNFFIPGSLLHADVDTTDPIAYGVPAKVDVDFDHSPSFILDPDAEQESVKSVAWYGNQPLLDSGWAWGDKYIRDTTAIAEATVGKGKVVLYGPEVTFRGQPHATFKFLFNGVLYGPSTEADVK
jgi:hypothetical protein